jgi:anti-sigma B factor antagonist
MNHKRIDIEDETTLEIEGTLDAVTAPDLRTVVDQLVADRRPSVTLELSSLRLIDSSGVGVIVSLFKRIRANGGQVKIVGLRDQPRAIFRLLRLDRVFPV